MAICDLIVCERTSRWAVAIRWALGGKAAGQGLRVYEARSLTDAWERLVRAPASVIAVEAEAVSVDALAERLRRMPAQFPQARSVLLGASATGMMARLWRELGVTYLVATPRGVDAVVRLALRQHERQPALQSGLRGQIWQRLPWATPNLVEPNPGTAGGT